MRRRAKSLIEADIHHVIAIVFEEKRRSLRLLVAFLETELWHRFGLLPLLNVVNLLRFLALFRLKHEVHLLSGGSWFIGSV